MKTRVLGENLTVSDVSLGCMGFIHAWAVCSFCCSSGAKM